MGTLVYRERRNRAGLRHDPMRRYDLLHLASEDWILQTVRQQLASARSAVGLESDIRASVNSTETVLNRICLIMLRAMVLPVLGYIGTILVLLVNFKENRADGTFLWIDSALMISMFSLFAG